MGPEEASQLPHGTLSATHSVGSGDSLSCLSLWPQALRKLETLAPEASLSHV